MRDEGGGSLRTWATAASVANANTVIFSLSVLTQRNDMSLATRRSSSVARLMALASEPMLTVRIAALTPDFVGGK